MGNSFAQYRLIFITSLMPFEKTESLMIENTYHWPPDGESRPWTEFWVTTFTRPVGGVKRVTLRYSVNPRDSWSRMEMEPSCVSGERDVWHVNLGTFPAKTRIQYAIEAVTEQDEQVWDNNGGRNHTARIGNHQDRAIEPPA